MTHLSDILDTGELDRLVNEKYISRIVSPDGRLLLHNYTERATYDRVWTAETRRCRGLISDAATGRIIARPFEKFSNVDEAGFPESSLSALLLRPGPVEITDKLDGSMVAVWHDDGAWHCSTRGSFTSTQAQAARAWLESRLFGWNSVLQDFTLLCEWCAPDNRVVLKYNTTDLVLIGARHVATGTDCHHRQLENIGTLALLNVVPIVTDTDLETLVSRRALTTGVEGWVARWPDGYRVKVKTEDYLRLHRLISGFSAARVRAAMLTGEAAHYVQELPEEIRAEAERIVATLERVCGERAAYLAITYARFAPLLSDSRKTFALAVQREPKEDWPYLFSLADDKPIAEKLLKAVDLAILFGNIAEAVPLDS